jgi:hypothetical protein
MDEVMTILLNVAVKGGGGRARELDPEPVVEIFAVPDPVIRADEIQEVGRFRAVTMQVTEHSSE